MPNSTAQWQAADSEVMRLRAEVEYLSGKVSFWRSQATAAQRKKAELYSLLMDLRVQIDRAFSSHTEEAT